MQRCQSMVRGKKRGFSSLNELVTAISVDTGKFIDCEIMSRNCKSCNVMQNIKQRDPGRYKTWYASHIHKCSLNYHGSALNMEKVGAVNIFQRSIEKHCLYFTAFYGDGDCKSFSAVENNYGDHDDSKKVIKYECIGHYQKRVGKRLRMLHKELKLEGKNRFTNQKIDTLQNYFGIVLRQKGNNGNTLPCFRLPC